MGRVKVPRQAAILKFDIKEFFMSGAHSNLARASSRWRPPGEQLALRDLTASILDAQVVSCIETGLYYKVETGSGMGLLCSREISDAAFY